MSSAGHPVRASLKADQAPPALSALERYAEVARRLSPAMLLKRDQGIVFANEAARLLLRAASRWPESISQLTKNGASLAESLLDRLPEDRRTPESAAFRALLTSGGQ